MSNWSESVSGAAALGASGSLLSLLKKTKMIINIGSQIYKVGEKIGEGSFGEVWKAQNVRSGEEVAIKFESKKARSMLDLEYKFYTKIRPQEGFPRVIQLGEIAGGFNALVLEYLGSSLAELLSKHYGVFSLKTNIMIAIQLLKIFEWMHSRGVIHRDVKPENFVIGRPQSEKENIIHVIDFGLAKEYMNEAEEHIPYKEGIGNVGTAPFMSLNAHLSRELSRRDDLEALGYVFLQFLNGSLPWEKVPHTKNVHRCMKELKEPIEELFKGFPGEFLEYLEYTRKLTFEEKPDYEYLRGLFEKFAIKNNITQDGKFDWSS